MIRSIDIEEAIEKRVVSFGNGSIVYTPKKWIGKTVTVILERKPVDVREEILKTLKEKLPEIQGIFLFGSFARNEQTEGSDIDVLAISDTLKLEKIGKLDFLCMPKNRLIEELEKDGTLFLWQIVQEAKPIFNEQLLRYFKSVKIKPEFSRFFDSTLGSFKKIKYFLDADKKNIEKYFSSAASIYSLVLRLKTIFLLQLYLKKQPFSNAKFEEFIEKHSFSAEKTKKFLDVYRAERDNTKTKENVLLEDAEKLFEAAKEEFLKAEKMVKKWAKRSTRKE